LAHQLLIELFYFIITLSLRLEGRRIVGLAAAQFGLGRLMRAPVPDIVDPREGCR
jgi:hypothetical protein